MMPSGGQRVFEPNTERTTRGYHKGWRSLYHKCGFRAPPEEMESLKLEVAIACRNFWLKRGIEEPTWTFRDMFKFKRDEAA